ncbi:DUF4097 family beta strand repeat protein [Balneolaceae bacterium YR4-1]|uniref:DUF4097 family beta strand repeat protein n=1 Tax=Halalkalibaculum roseum TaxID=2709311 RepID=A0A6M1T621_9BACT|nr:DUF4097 family beta strand repeat-containing protein [Halalkalibaculum roseum]NGP77435.1 DUF4097 family beta strand repeat protein [Halalkalibaculum roseum]
MNNTSRSWEIVLAGIAFVAIAVYLIGNHDSRPEEPRAPESPEAFTVEPSLPSTIVIDLQNLENLKNLENLSNLKNIENLEQLEFELKNLDKIIEERINTQAEQESVEKSLRMVEEKLQNIDKADYKVQLQNKKIFINKDYNVEEANWTEASPGVFIYRKSLPLGELKAFNLSMGFGNLNIIGEESTQGELTIRATGNVESAKEIRDNLEVVNRVDNEAAYFEVSPGSQSSFSDRVNLEATLKMPKNMKLDASTRGGHINANNLDGEHKLFTSGGHIILDAISGTTEAESSGGHITCDRLNGSAMLKTAGGHIKVSNANADLSATTGGGHIELEQFDGQVDAKTSGGNISAEILSATGPLSFVTSAGNISLVIPQNLSADIKAKGNMVSMEEGFQFDGNKSKTGISGTLNGGGVPLTLSCKYGNVNIAHD